MNEELQNRINDITKEENDILGKFNNNEIDLKDYDMFKDYLKQLRKEKRVIERELKELEGKSR